MLIGWDMLKGSLGGSGLYFATSKERGIDWENAYKYIGNGVWDMRT